MRGALVGPARGADDEGSHRDLRCLCGSLVARRTPEGIELKCRRCRRGLLVRLDAEGGVLLEPR